MASSRNTSGLEHFHTVVQNWFGDVFGEATDAQKGAWPAITSNQHTLLLAPTGSGKTLAAFLVAINRLMFPQPVVTPRPGVKTLYISPLKALGVDIERNLRVPLQGIRQVAERMGVDHHNPLIAVRTGDTPPGDRQRMLRRPPDILITTPESLYLLLTSSGRNILRHVECVIVDEIHAMAATKRGAHLFTTLERLEDWVQQNHGNPVQRIGLSATQQPLEEVARLLGGFSANANPRSAPQPRAVAIIEAGRRRALQLTVEVPVEDMARLSEQSAESFATPGAIAVPSIWPAIYPRLVELIRSHRTTLVFVNSRRLAERVAQSINESAKADIARAHHGSLAKDVRLGIESSLKLGELPAIVATSSLELGIDMGSIDLVIQIESPPTVAAGIQRIGRSGHHVGGVSEGRIFPKFRADLLACSAAAARMMSGEVESTYYPRNPLDVLAQQVVAIVAGGPQHSDAIYRIVRGAAPFRDLTLHVYYGVLDLMSGRYPSTNFAELRPRINWDRVTNILSPRKSSQRTAILNAGTIPDRGLYGVFLDNGGEKSMRVGELDEEMVFETRAGEVFTLGASSWRVTDITRDRVLVVPAPGEPAKMPFWRGDSPGRPFEFGKAIGKLTRELLSVHVTEAQHRLVTKHGLDARAADNLLAYLSDQREATQYVPSDRTIVIESFLDEVGDYRIAILSPFGARVNAPWTTAITARLRADLQIDVDSTWSDDGILLRVPKTVGAPDMSVLVPASHEVETIVTRELGSTALFAARFRENAARALLLPRQQPGKRVPLWLQRRKAADLLAVAAKYPQFPILLETYRECLRDVFDLPSLQELLSQIECGAIHIHQLHNDSPSPFAASLLFSYSGNFIYNGDTPLAERKAQSLTLDYAQLREILGAGEIRELIDPGVLDTTALELQRQSGNLSIRSADDLHDLLRNLGDLTQDEILQRRGASSADLIDTWLQELLESRRVILVSIHQDARLIAVEDAGRYRDALGLTLPTGIPEAFIERCSNALEELVSRYARTHVPFSAV
ncbi:MAG: DEAD/DEAH box helicase, partial [Planctomycetota bacterium]|nr:DEAD/DEAH box helicase [Planctomycetota bacterium]